MSYTRCTTCGSKIQEGKACKICLSKLSFCNFSGCPNRGKLFDVKTMQVFGMFYFDSQLCMNQFKQLNGL